MGDFREPGAGDVPWSTWRGYEGPLAVEPKCTLDGVAQPCDEAEVVLSDLAPGRHVFRVLAGAPLPEDIGPAAGTAENPIGFLIEAPFTVAEPQPVKPVEPAPTPTPTPAPASPAPAEPATPVQPQLPLASPPAAEGETSTTPACTKRKLTVVVPQRRGQRIRSAVVTVDGTRVAVKKRRGRYVAIVPADRLAGEVAVVKMTVRYKNGSRKRFTQRVSTCR